MIDPSFCVRIDLSDLLTQISRKLFLTHNVHKKSPTINIAWCAVFRKCKKPPPPKNQPPTDSNALIHILGVHGQYQVWKGADKPDPPIVDIRVHGWEMKDEVTTPVIYAAPPTPQNTKLLVMVSCQCGVQINKTCTTGRCCLPVHYLYYACDGVNIWRKWGWRGEYSHFGNINVRLVTLLIRWRTCISGERWKLRIWLSGWLFGHIMWFQVCVSVNALMVCAYHFTVR